MNTAIEVSNLVKDYDGFRAVDGLSFSVDPGEVVAILGPNGAGKTTTVEILEGHRVATSGVVSVLGLDPASAGRAFRERIGIVLQSTGIEEVLTPREALETYGHAYPSRLAPDAVLELVGLTDEADTRIQALSGGQQRRVDLALGLVGDPDLLFLDEPTTGFDPAARRRSWELIENLTGLGKTVLLTTHYLDEAEQLADRVVVIAGGSLVAQGTPAELRADLGGATTISFRIPTGDDPVDELLGAVTGEVKGRNGRLEIRTTSPTADLHTVTGWAVQRSFELVELAVAPASLEDVYLDLVGDGGGR